MLSTWMTPIPPSKIYRITTQNLRCDVVFQLFLFFFFNDTATTEIYTLSLHDALPILDLPVPVAIGREGHLRAVGRPSGQRDRKSTRLNSSHGYISYAVFCLKKKKKDVGALMNPCCCYHGHAGCTD